MSQRPMNDEFDATIGRYLEWRSERLAGAPDAGTVAAAIDRTINGRPHAARRGALSGVSAWAVLVLLGLLLAIVGAAVGSRLMTEPPGSSRALLSIRGSCCGVGIVGDAGGTILVGKLEPGRLRLIRFDGNGRMDRTFGTDGIASLESDQLETAISVARQSDGKLVVVRRFGIGAVEVVRLLTDGSVDESFGGTGGVHFTLSEADLPDSEGTPAQVLVTSNGSIVVVGTGDNRLLLPGVGNRAPPEDFRFAVARFHPDGSIDPTFGTNGWVVENVGAGRDTAVAVAVAPDGSLLVAGQTGYMTPGPQDNNIAVLRLQSDGTRDESFDHDGVVSTHVEETMNSSAGGIALAPDGRIVVTGRGYSSHAVVRYLEDGSLDPSLAGDGTLNLSADVFPRDSLVQDDGKIVLVADGQLLRLTVDGERDATFGSSGVVELP